jgi:hypothetical protein
VVASSLLLPSEPSYPPFIWRLRDRIKPNDPAGNHQVDEEEKLSANENSHAVAVSPSCIRYQVTLQFQSADDKGGRALCAAIRSRTSGISTATPGSMVDDDG